MSSWSVSNEHTYPRGDNPFGNAFYGYRTLDVSLPNNQQATYHGLLIGDCVHIVALEEDQTTYLIRQPRPNAMAAHSNQIPNTLELPGGFAPLGLSLESHAQLELHEELRRHAGSLSFVGTILPSPGISNEHDYIFLGTDLSPIEDASSGESTEMDMEIVEGKFGTIYSQMLRSELPVSGQTLAAMAKVAILL